MKQTIKQQRAGFEMLCQKAGIINREMDAKCEKMEQLAGDVKADARECADWATRCAGHTVEANRACNDAGLWCEAAHRAARFAMWCASAALVFLLGMICVLFVR